ncbi:MAG: helix-turn-helix transcriptional regulator [Firmicutes bacterium]|nr:helix-turn-helix transcriptional regulator [Bacillota bacterium]
MSVRRISTETGISEGTFADWKSGRSTPSASKLITLAEYLGCSVDYLLGRTDEKTFESKTQMTYFKDVTDINTAEKPIIFQSMDEFVKYRNETNNIIFLNPFVLEEVFTRILKKNKVRYSVNDVFDENIPFEERQKNFYNFTNLDFTDITPKNLYEKGYIIKSEYEEFQDYLTQIPKER